MSDKKTAVITGGSRGIGRAICVRLAKAGMDVVFSYRSGKEAADETVKLCEEYGVKATAICGDVSDSKQCKEFMAEALKIAQNGIDVLVNNAGITKDGLIVRMSDEDFDAVIDVNLKGAFYMMREAAGIMLKQRRGKIVNISSVAGVMGNAGQTNYAASKAGIIGMTKSLARELAGRKITVNAIAPGMIETDMTGVLSDRDKENILSSIPFKTMGKPEDIANAVAFLSSDESSYITGQVICVDGGMAI